MNASTETEPSGSLDFLKWGVIVLLLAGAVVGNYIFAEQSVLVRALAVVAAIVVAGLVAMQTVKGRNAVDFAKESRTEVRKVVWPTRQTFLLSHECQYVQAMFFEHDLHNQKTLVLHTNVILDYCFFQAHL